MEYEIKAKFERVFSIDKLKVGNIIFLFKKREDVIIHFKIEKTEPNYILAREMAFDGNPIKQKKRNLERFTQKTLDENEIKVIVDKTNDQNLWPINIAQAMLKLKSLYTPEE